MMSEERVVSVRLNDLCNLADAVGTIIHDLDNGKRKYLHIEVNRIHEIVEKWVSDEEVLGSGCHEHRCQICREYGWSGERPVPFQPEIDL